MLLREIKEPQPFATTQMEADRARVVDRLTKEGRPGRSLPHTARHKRTRKQQILKPVLSFMTHPRLRVDRATTPGRGIYHDGRSLARGFWEGNILWRSRCYTATGRYRSLKRPLSSPIADVIVSLISKVANQ